MEVALITPTSLLPTIGNMTKYHMLLPDQYNSKPYWGHYNDRIGYKILDNGVAEQFQYTFDALTSMARFLRVQEVVIPDVMQDGIETLDYMRRWKKSLDTLERIHRPGLPQDLQFKYMAVAQGVTMGELYFTIEQYLKEDWINVIAFPRVMCAQHGHDARIEAVEFWQDDILAADKEIHCLGSSHYLHEVQSLCQLHVRGIDTCMPIEAARSGIDLSQEDLEWTYSKRLSGFFDWQPTTNEETWLVIKNCNTYLEWAQWEGYTPNNSPEVV